MDAERLILIVGVVVLMQLAFAVAKRQERDHPERFRRYAPRVFGVIIAVAILGVLLIIVSIPNGNPS